MSMYSLVFGSGGDHRATFLAAVLDEAAGAPVVSNLRLRDGWIEKKDDRVAIVIYTRNGGGNRECFCDDYSDSPNFRRGTCTGCNGERATEHRDYLTDQDDDFDSTYRTYSFKLPDGLDPEIRERLVEAAQDPVDTDARWLAAIDAIGGAR